MKTKARYPNFYPADSFDELLNEASALRQRQSRPSAKRTFVEFEMFDKHITLGKTSKTLRCLNKKERGKVLTLNGKVEGSSILDFLKENITSPEKRTPERH